MNHMHLTALFHPAIIRRTFFAKCYSLLYLLYAHMRALILSRAKAKEA